MPDLEQLTGGEIQPLGPPWSDKHYGRKWFSTTQVLNRTISWTAFSERTWSYRVINVDGEVVYTDSVTVRGSGETERLSATLRRLNTPLSFMKHLRSAVQAPVHGRNHLQEARTGFKLKFNYRATHILCLL